MASCSEEKKFVLLISSDGELFEVLEAAALLSGTIQTILKYGAATKEIPLRKVDSKTLRKVIQFCNRRAAGNTYLNETLEQFGINFLEPLNIIELFDLIWAASCMDIKCLMALAIEGVKSEMEKKGTDEFFKYVNENQRETHYTPSELANCISQFYKDFHNPGNGNKDLVLVTSDNEIFGYPEAAAMLSECIKKVLEEGFIQGIPVPNVDPKALSKVLELINMDEDEYDDQSRNEYESVKDNVLFDCITCIMCLYSKNSAMDIKHLHGLLTDTIADKMKSKSIEEVGQYLKEVRCDDTGF